MNNVDVEKKLCWFSEIDNTDISLQYLRFLQLNPIAPDCGELFCKKFELRQAAENDFNGMTFPFAKIVKKFSISVI